MAPFRRPLLQSADPRISSQNFGISCQKIWFSWVPGIQNFLAPAHGPYPQYGWDFPGKIPERPRKRFLDSPREYGWDSNQRAENGALDPWSLNLRFGAPRFSVEKPQNPCFEGFRSDLGQKYGAPQMQIQRPRIQCPNLGPLIKEPCNSRHLKAPEHFQNSPPPVRLGRPLFQDVVPERASQSRSWHSGVSKKCPRVSLECCKGVPDTPQTLSGHSRTWGPASLPVLKNPPFPPSVGSLAISTGSPV